MDVQNQFLLSQTNAFLLRKTNVQEAKIQKIRLRRATQRQAHNYNGKCIDIFSRMTF